jgi:hypothetical protein
MTPEQISYFITEDIHINNGIILEAEEAEAQAGFIEKAIDAGIRKLAKSKSPALTKWLLDPGEETGAVLIDAIMEGALSILTSTIPLIGDKLAGVAANQLKKLPFYQSISKKVGNFIMQKLLPGKISDALSNDYEILKKFDVPDDIAAKYQDPKALKMIILILNALSDQQQLHDAELALLRSGGAGV